MVDQCRYKPVDGQYNRDASVWLPPGEWHDAFSGEVMAGGKTITLHNESLERMPLFHRGGGMVITAAADQSNAKSTGWSDLKLHIWPTRAAFATNGWRQVDASQNDTGVDASGVVTSTVGMDLHERLQVASPQSRLLYTPSDVEPDATAPPLTKIYKIEHPGRGFELSFEATNTSTKAAEQHWTVRVHVPLGSTFLDVAMLQMRCGDSTILLTEYTPTRLHLMPFGGAGHAPHRAPNSVMQGMVVLGESRTVKCEFGF